MELAIMLIVMLIVDNFSTICLGALGLWVLGLIEENVEFFSVIAFIISLLVTITIYKDITDFLFGRPLIGILIAVVANVCFLMLLGLSGWFIITLVFIDFLAVICFAEESDLLSAILIPISFIIPAIIALKN